MVRRTGRPGYHFRSKSRGKITWIALGTDYDEALRKLRSLKAEAGERKPRTEVTVREGAERWLASHVATARAPRSQVLARRRVEPFSQQLEVVNNCLHAGSKFLLRRRHNLAVV